MSLNLEQKKAVVEEVSGVLKSAQAAIIAEYRGLTVAQMSELRRKAHDADVYLRIVKNTLAKRAIEGSDFECLKDMFVGPLAFGISSDPVAVARVFDSFAKDNELLQIKAGVMAGKLMEIAELKVLAKLPGRDELLAQLLATMQAPVQKFVQTLNEVPGKFVRTLAAVRDNKEAA